MKTNLRNSNENIENWYNMCIKQTINITDVLNG